MMTLEGYAARFDTEAVIANAFRERILPGAFRDSITSDDVRALFNHNVDNVLGRTGSHTLELWEDALGLRYRIALNEADPAAVAVAARVARRDITGSSFWFAIDSPEDEEWRIDDPKKLPLRTLRRLRLVDVGPVTLPAYPDTSAAVVTRGLTAIRERLRLQLEIASMK